MKHLLLIFSVLIAINLSAQTLRGRVLNVNNEAVPSASVYVAQTKQGLITNDLGEFEVKLKQGTYDLEIRCLGYEKTNLKITVQNADLEQTVYLLYNDFQLQEVVTVAGEDPAYRIMRKAIKKAPYYQNVVKSSVYEAYTKGSGKMTGVPALILLMGGKEAEKEIGLIKDKTFLLESFCEVKFTAPEHYEQNIKAFSSSFPMMDDPKNAMFAGMYSLYNPNFAVAMSPLNEKALDYYRFKHEGLDDENGETIHKIRVIPKLKDARFLEGVLYIADNQWDIRYADITVSAFGMQINYKLNYHSVAEDIYIVTDYEAAIAANIMGLKFEGTLLSAMQFTDIQLNDSLIAIEKAKETPAKVVKKKEKRNLEIKWENPLKQNVDSLANLRDSAYWDNVRTVVLTDEERQSYARRDTLEQHIDSIEKAEKNPTFSVSDLLTGGRVGNDSSLLYFSYSGLNGAVHDYNFADGFLIGQKFSFDFKNRKGKHLVLYPAAWWAVGRKNLLWELDATLNYAPKRLGFVDLTFGRNSEDYSAEYGMDRSLNRIYSVLTGRNYAKLYDHKYITMSNSIDLANGLNLGVGAQIAQRQPLANSTTWNIFGRKNKWTENLPNFQNAMNEEFADLAKFSVQLTYTPEYYYRMDGMNKRYVRSRFPTFVLDFQRGMQVSNRFANKNTASVFNRLEFSVSQNIHLNIFSRFNYKLVAGKFLNNNAFSYIDYKHFGTSGDLLFSIKDVSYSFALLPFYQYSTNNQWIEAFLNYNSDYILLKRLPFMQGKILNESLHFKLLHTPDKPLYSELGYSIGFYDVARLAVFTAFDKFTYNSVGFQVSMPLFNLFGKKKNNSGTITIGAEGVDVDIQ
ncbi:MAG: DUF5686 and carboxypeptidase regulatory-like domain-containing protein [Prevotellaceae bacterium]|jgi:hypothetical protein|nr:DUF5686 and carboxypeptidase regulatory-like domain-containing protein [Prevotellaceae bacterium]